MGQRGWSERVRTSIAVFVWSLGGGYCSDCRGSCLGGWVDSMNCGMWRGLGSATGGCRMCLDRHAELIRSGLGWTFKPTEPIAGRREGSPESRGTEPTRSSLLAMLPAAPHHDHRAARCAGGSDADAESSMDKTGGGAVQHGGPIMSFGW
ncbi:uncharacterized protein BJ171DRAFT_508890 [Polychytrium aggregatum]|uniref:uncharacterized protein n=1 Tax=Polychytrium aggregatum TaxID=110093 RepID=UPI0022FDBD92|nr:uncharacterized protein BJ171DRAFT_508890 [Polychytrium aggregatum]KAI9203579.1 hypothetical protein BJ171DRAFT_508890 [Polychytrium aggregatum]